MGMYGDALKKLDTGQYVKLEAGQSKTLRILDHPYVATKAWDDNISNRFFWIVWDYDMQTVRILEQGKSVFDQVAKLVEKWPDGERMPSPFDIDIEREGGGQFDTKYFVNGVPQRGTMPSSAGLRDQIESTRANIIQKNRAIGLKDIIGGAKPEVIAAGKSAALLDSGERRPTHQDAEALGGDVVPT